MLRGSDDAFQNSYEFFALTECALRFGLSVSKILSKFFPSLNVCDYYYYYDGYYYYYYYYYYCGCHNYNLILVVGGGDHFVLN